MAEELEIEFKNLLTHDEYFSIKQYYFKQKAPFKQTNYYIDTYNQDIISKKMALRIREKHHQYEMTLKIPQKIGLLEINEPIDSLPKLGEKLCIDMLPPSISEALNKHHIVLNDLVLLGSLTTYRLEQKLDTGLLVLDHSIYLNEEDFELEFEVSDFDKGEIDFSSILENLNIERRIPANKVKRFFDAAKKSN
ncbi:CYTH domain-containing protein [Mammaliicoccus stepanovicii]|uniref:Adenylate cyclase n=1 Tax=Mammaliicoccus stepanovicii TaxID=643214 RepID=A0A239ZT74_9STAP|nr:CYTH domain-containing protein [Mammaliicoccus stepanovicii]PNZ77087.1 CYTH domain-containing protein [Mammaliicoccus stepanovicii]GGI38825.1 adenylate cyclase [Mammaliicoccus stepanovicii]SNV73988.1 adenylate cyclase [Mammaliicoccus stepanovicii]